MAKIAGRLPSLNGLKAFDAAARHLNFRLAAEELGVTQGAVAQQVRGLEAELEIRLFERLPRTLALTGEGRTYFADISRAFTLIAEATASLRPEPERLTLSVTPTFASKWLVPRLPDFMALHPLLDLHILATERLSAFHGDGVDLAVRYGRPPFGPGLVAELLFEQDIIAVCSPALIAGREPPFTLEVLGAPVLLHDAHNFWPEFIATLPGENPGIANKGIRFNQTAHAIEAAIAGQGIALANSFFVEADLKAGRLVQPFPASLRGTADFFVVQPRNRRSAASETVRTWLLSHRGTGHDTLLPIDSNAS